VSVAPANTFYSPQGDVLCSACNAAAEIDVGEGRAMKSLMASGYGALGVGALSLLCNPFLITSLVAIGGGISTIRSLLVHPEYHAKLGGQVPILYISAGLGILLGLVHPFILGMAACFSIALG